MSDHQYTKNADAYEDINAAFRWLTEHEKGPRIPREQVVLFGRSLGSGPTVDLASRTRGLAGLAAFSANLPFPAALCALQR